MKNKLKEGQAVPPIKLKDFQKQQNKRRSAPGEVPFIKKERGNN